MTFLEQRIDARITQGLDFEVLHPSRKKLYASGGQLDQHFGESPPRHLVDLAHGARSRSEFQTLVDSFYVVMFTPYEGLRVKNWSDYQASATNSAVAALGGGVYQLQRKHVFGGVTFLRNIYKPVNNGALSVYDSGGSPLTPTIDYAAGTFTVASGTPNYWVGEFDLPMTFIENTWNAKLEGGNGGFAVSGTIRMEEILL